jgi:hypothetical protein
MSYHSPKCFYKLCEKCDVTGCACSCHKINKRSSVIQFIQRERPKSNLMKRKEKLIKVIDPDNVLNDKYNSND